MTSYQKFKEMCSELMKHKWIESEKAGKDIGFENALTDWLCNHKKNWISHIQNKNKNEKI